MLPQTPLVSAAAASVNTPAVTLAIATGTGLANCNTFSALAITEDIATAPVTPGAYTYSCSQAPSQNFLYTLQNGVGAHTLYLWAMDAAGVVSLTPRSVSVNYSLIVPNVAISSPAPGLSFQNSVTIAGSCEDDAGDVSLSGPIAGSPVRTVCSGSAFSRAVVLAGSDGSKSIQAAQTNQFGNTGAATVSITKDETAPTITITSLTPAVTNAASFTVGLAFSESVTGFNASKLAVTNATIAGFTGSGASYSITLAPIGQGTVTVDIAGGAAADAAGNGNVAASTFSRLFDSQAPTVTLASSSPALTKNSPIPYTATFSEPVSGFSLASLSVSNGVAGGLSGSGASYSFHVTPSAQGVVSVTVSANGAQDQAGNASTASTTLARTFDSLGPTLSLNSSATNPTNATPIPVQAVFGESVTGFSLASVSVTNGTAGNLAGSGTTYTFEVTPLANGAVSVAVANGAGRDAAGNDSDAASISRTFNNSRPSVNLTSVRPSPTNLAPFPVSVTFSAPVTGFDATKLTVTNATISGFGGSGTTYSFQANPSGNGSVTMSVAANSAVDSAANQNLASNSLAITYDTVAPTVSITSPAAASFVNASSQGAFTIAGACSEPGVTVAVAVGSVSGTASCTSGAWTLNLDLSPLADGSLSLTANQTDLAGNVGSASAVTVTKDTSAPTILLGGAPSAASNSVTLNVTGSGAGVSAYRYKVGAASATDCAVATGYSAEVGIGTSITDSISGLADGPIRLCAVARDLAGNFQPFASATMATWTKDTAVIPFTGLALTPSSPGRFTTPTVSGTTEAGAAVQIFGQAACAGSAIGSVTAGGGGAFSAATSALGADGSYTLSAKATDAAGNTLCSSNLPYLLDTIAPAVTISSSAPTNTNTSPVPVALVFAEPVTGLALAGLNVTNGSAAGLTGSGTNYTFSVTPSGQGAVTVAVAAGAATDAAGNASQASLTLTRTFDTVAPALTIATPAAGAGFNTGTLTLTGACETGLSIALGGSGLSSPSSATCTASAYSVAIIPTAGDGTKNITLTQTDPAGNTATQTRAFEKDTVAPTLLFTSVAVQNQNTNANSATFTGSCEAGVSIIVTGTDTNSIACTGASWSYATNPKATDGSRSYVFTQTDSAGNTTSITGSWIRDTVLPAVAITSPAAGFVAYESITVAGTCETGVPVTLSGPGLLGDINNVPCNSGAFSRFAYYSSGDGAKVVTATQTDLAGNAGTSTRSFVRDTTPPALTQTLRANPYANNANTAQFGGACENGLGISVTGTESGSAACSSGAWTYTTNSQSTDASRSYTFRQTDAAGNQTQLTTTWVRDTVAPLLAFTSASSFTTSGNTVSFAGTCESGLSIAVSGAQTAIVPCVSGAWSFATNQTTDNIFNYTFTETDLAGNASSVTGTWTRSTSGPTLTITQSTPQITNGSSLVISGTCSGGTAGSSGTINISGAVTTTIACSSTNASVGSWSYTANQGADGTYNYTFGLTDNFASPRSTSASLSWVRDATLPVIADGSFTISGGQATTAVSYNPVAFSATDNATTVAKFCLKSTSTAPTASDSCWYPIGGAGTGTSPSNAVAVSAYPFNIGIVPQSYSIYLWVMDGAKNISANSATNARDLASITLSPLPPPAVSAVLVSNSDTMSGSSAERQIPGGSDAFIRWSASGSSLPANPITLAFTTDDSTWTTLASNLTNGINNCDSLTGPGSASSTSTGCFKWNSGSPTSSYYKVRVTVTNTLGATTFANSAPVNSALLQILAGNVEPGVNGSASSAIFQNDYRSFGQMDMSNLAVRSDGTIYFRDLNMGILQVSPTDGKLKVLVPSGATSSGVGDGGPASQAKLRSPAIMVMDYQDRLLVFDYDRIRRIDLKQNPPTITTIIGGGASTADSLANPLQLQMAAMPAVYSAAQAQLKVLPNGNIYFFSENFTWNAGKRFRLYEASTNSIKSIYQTGPSSGSIPYSGYSVSNVANCYATVFDMEFDVASSAIANFMVTTLGYVACTGVSGTRDPSFFLDPSTGQVISSPVPPTAPSGIRSVSIDAHDGKIYRVQRGSGRISRFDAASNTWVNILGSGTVGSCADDTAALSCNIDPGGAFIDAQGTIFFSDRGRIRTVANGKVVTLYGQAFNFGDGGAASEARFGLIPSVLQKADRSFVLFDYLTGRIRSFARNGIIQTLAGNDITSVVPNTSSAANSQPTSISNYLFSMDQNDRIYTFMGGKIFRLNTSPGSVWSSPYGGGANAWYASAANGAQASTVSLGAITLLGNNGSSLLYNSWANGLTYTPSSILSEIDLSSNVNSVSMGVLDPSSSVYASTYCADTTLLSNCHPPPNGAAGITSPEYTRASWDNVALKWVVMDTDGKKLRSFRDRTGTIATVTTLTNTAKSFEFQNIGSRRYVYYCSTSSGTIYLRDVDAGVEKALPWPVSSLRCDGKTLVYDATSKSLIFPFTQNGLYGVAELLSADPASNGL